MKVRELFTQAQAKGYFMADPSLMDYEKGNPVTGSEYYERRLTGEMVCLQQWLRDEHKTHVRAEPADVGEEEEEVKWYYNYIRLRNDLGDGSYDSAWFDTYEEALCEGLLAACLSIRA